jgi:hypothetical protein
VIACWQNRPHEGLSHTWGEGRDLSPNEMFAACVGISGYVPLPLTGDDYIELLPAVFRTVNDYGLTIDNRTYDCKALNPYRRLDSGLPGDANRPARQHAEDREEPPPSDTAPEDELSEPSEIDRAVDQDSYDVFDPGGVRWRL